MLRRRHFLPAMAELKSWEVTRYLFDLSRDLSTGVGEPCRQISTAPMDDIGPMGWGPIGNDVPHPIGNEGS
jgi:hypothetical protein